VESSFSPYQKIIFDKIVSFRDDVFTPYNFSEIADKLNNEGLKTPRNSIFKNNHVHSIFKKGNIRKERMKRKNKIEILDILVEVGYPIKGI
jgi:hypothetical protein